MRRPIRASDKVVFALLALVGCAPSTQISTVWKDPSAGATPFKRVIVCVIGRDQSMRRVAEDAFVQSLPKGVAGVPSYSIMGDTNMQDTLAVRAKVKESGCDGVVLYRLVGVDKETRYVPGTTYTMGYGYPYYGTWGGYYGYASSMAYSPGYMTEDKIIQVECNAYSVSDERLEWTARSETINPASVQSLIDDVVRVTVTQMRTDKILP
jgi:hypothetical protein